MVCTDHDIGIFSQYAFDKACGLVTFRRSAFRRINKVQTKFLTGQGSVTTIHNHPQGIAVNDGLDLRRIGIGRLTVQFGIPPVDLAHIDR